ncbi:MAG: glycosyltransferase family 4 protein [Deltaproteobacteria bacterium]|nr:glycosyltransferase family 4 protein [Deltaproteobacteria bacterium]
MAVAIPKYGLIGGGERFAAELTERLARKGKYEFHVFANRWSSGSGDIVFHKVPAIRFPRFLRPVGFARFVDRMVSGGSFDLVHSHERIYCADIFSLHSVPHAGWVRDVRRKRPGLFDLATVSVEKRMMGCGARRFLPVSTLAKDAFAREYGVDPSMFLVAHPGVDVERFSSPDRAACRREVRSRYGIGLEDTVILFVGMNFEVKGLDVIMASVACAGRKHAGERIRLLVVGKGDRRKYEGIANRLGIGEAVVFTGPQADGMERFYLASDVFAMLSKFDTFGMAVLEAMAAGIPVVISAGVGAKDLVENGRNGFVVDDPEDAGAAADRIGLLMDGETRLRMGREARSTAREHSWDRLAEDMEGIYEELLG